LKLLNKNFVTSDDLFTHLKRMIKSGTKLKLEIEDISWGDRYYSENGESINFIIADKNYRVGYSYIIEDADDWGQAESHQVTWCDCDGKRIEPSVLLDIVNNWESIERENKLNKII